MEKGKAPVMDLWSKAFGSKQEYGRWISENKAILAYRRAKEFELQSALPTGENAIYLGYCVVCRSHSHFTYDWKYAFEDRINWRESLICKTCGLASRLRLAVHVFERLLDEPSRSQVYLTEQLGPLAVVLQNRCRTLVCSEFLGADVRGGSIDARGLRHEDLTRLSFSDSTFDMVLCFDVLEHVPDYQRALLEIRRVLKPNGRLLASAPFAPGVEANIVRALRDDNGVVKHLLPPEFHGDPVDPKHGVLCYYNFGWQIVEDIRTAGFSEAKVQFSWSTDFAYIGHEQPLFIAAV